MEKSIFFFIFMGSSPALIWQEQKKQHGEKKTHHQHHSELPYTPLKQTGSDVFDAMQEVIEHLKSDPDTDWSKVDLEGLRQHLIDMKAFTEEVEVLEQNPIDSGVKILVKPETDRAAKALQHMLSMHPKMMKVERNWDMKAQQKKDVWEIACTTSNPDEVDLLRGLRSEEHT